MGETNKLSRPVKPSGLNIPTEIVRMAHEVIRYVLVMRDSGRKVLVPLCGGGIRRRLLMWGLGLFGIALITVVAASYYYTVRQIERDAADLQREIASVTAERIRDFVQRKIERISDTADAVSLYPMGSKEQQLLVSLLAKNDTSFTDASIIDARGMEVLKVSDRRVYFPSDLSDQSKSAKFNKAIKVEDFLEHHKEFVLDDAAGYLPQEANPMVRDSYYIALPHRNDTDGFFAARMRKVG